MYRRAAIQEYGEMREQRVEQEKVQRHTIQNDRDLFRGHPRLYTAEQLGSLATNPYL